MENFQINQRQQILDVILIWKNMKTFIKDEESSQQAHFLFDACHLFKKKCAKLF